MTLLPLLRPFLATAKKSSLIQATRSQRAIIINANAALKLFSSSTSVAASTPASLLKILPEVSNALSTNQPVVALESTILAHGLPHPQNIQLANELSSIIRSKGAIPATIAVKDGICRVGLTKEELEDLAISGEEGRAAKCSTKDLPLILAKHQYHKIEGKAQWGATTVASTMHLAHKAGIPTFVTGGTGGVHRCGESTMDVSADLLELARTPVIVVSAGVKSILDIEKTLEVLETNGVPAVRFGSGGGGKGEGGSDNDFPAFFSPSSGVKTPATVESAEEVAHAYLASLQLGLSNGILVAVPNQDPAGTEVEEAIQETLEEANKLGIVGRDVTPYILKRVAEKTKGESLKSNTALVKENAAVGADIALAISRMKAKSNKKAGSKRHENRGEIGNDSSQSTDYQSQLPIHQQRQSQSNSQPQQSVNCISRVVVMGGSVVDLVAKPLHGLDLIAATSNPGTCHESDGGVGRNVAEVLGRLGSNPTFFTAVGDDSRGNALIKRMQEVCGVNQRVNDDVNIVKDSNTATYLAVLQSNGDLHTAIADMAVLDQIPVPDEERLAQVDYLVVDANPPIQSLVQAAQNARWARTKVCFEPTSVPKAAEVAKNAQFMSAISYAFPNLDELFAMAGECIDSNDSESDGFEKIIQATARTVLKKCNPTESHLVITMGANGVVLASRYEMKPISFKYFEATAIEVMNCTGAGDTLAGAFIHALISGCKEEEAVKRGMEKASLSLKCEERAISPSI